ncbi:MAG: hypothetical protein IT462_15195 [Planctomycetes bacterium]|nr:hypothetical protein [Planctomycetota bacterium]
MLLSHANLKVHVAAAHRGRYALDTIALTKKGSVSTDGRLVLYVPYPTAKPADAPTIPGVNVSSPTPDSPVLVRTDDATRAAGMVGKGKRGYASPFAGLIQAEVKDDKIVFGATDLSSPQVMTVGRDEGAWPNIGPLLPNMSKAVTITLDLDTTLKALKTLRAASKEQEVTLRILSDQDGVSFSTRDGVAMYQMPVTVKAPEDHCPDNLVAFKDQPATVTAPETTAPDASAASAPETSEAPAGSGDELTEWPDEDEEGDSDDYADDDEYQDDGPIESEMEDAAEVLAKAEATTPEKLENPAAATAVTEPDAATMAVAAASDAPSSPTPVTPFDVGAAETPISVVTISAAPAPVETPVEEVAVTV